MKYGDEWKALASYKDGVPAVITRARGKGRLYFFNFSYNYTWGWQRGWNMDIRRWRSGPGSKERQIFYKLVGEVCKRAGAERTFRLDGNLSELLRLGIREFSDRTGRIRYAILGLGPEDPWTSGRLHWLGGEGAAYTVYDGEPRPSVLHESKSLPLHFMPGTLRLMGFVERPIHTVRTTASPPRPKPGGPIRLTVDVLDAEGKAIPGAFPLTVRAFDSKGRSMPQFNRAASLESGGAITTTPRWTIRRGGGPSSSQKA